MTMNTTKILSTLALALGCMLFWPACGADECVAGTNCDCAGGSCDLVCGGPGQASCNVNCSEGADCALDCPGGSCNLSCNGAASCKLNCGKGSCNLNCVGTSVCEITECTSSCNLNCGGAATCSSSCDATQSCMTSK